ncbi:MAG: bifunctional [glutamate--ammonia ligase]-adenylyl-L-tyrosine phosphorylase/[glutamate--ammonia-ligase] adenylyltransferase [Gammaproteobacteria bacterium]|nr:bifunctional [glutamate--ammonia ligase]-adenylyl-L-tyrosine phosphorylase/[glutamate--ammonia-ligase] adenylyltransferase [Gammaproteobacteria bacterium]
MVTRAAIEALYRFSPFIEQSCQQDSELPQRLIDADRLERTTPEHEYRTLLKQRLKSVSNDPQLSTLLRSFRREEMVRIALRDLAGWGDYHSTVEELSALAEVILSETLDQLYRWQCAEEGTPKGEQSGKPQQMVVVAMGKLGARELNFSSDIDLIFAYPEDGETRGVRPWISNAQFFTHLGQRLIRAIGARRADGFVFRVDMRLRPFGESGALSSSFDAMEDYYQLHGRSWERYAWIKGRVVAGDRIAGEALLGILRPFIYRRYFDYSAFDSLREMKQMIARQVRKKGRMDDLKLGPGGIREIEFIGQAFQLVRGGADRSLQVRPLLKVLPLLTQRGEISHQQEQALTDAYLFLRNCEHRIQEYEDRQTQLLPQSEQRQQLLAESMGFEGWRDFSSELERHRTEVEQQFEQLFSTDKVEESPYQQLWEGVEQGVEVEGAESLLNRFSEPKRALEVMRQLLQVSAIQSMSREGRERLDRLMPHLLESASQQQAPDESLLRGIRLIEAIGRRSVYFSLLAESGTALNHLLMLLQKSSWIAEQLAQTPMMLEDLMDDRNLSMPTGPEPLIEELRWMADQADEQDLEQQMELMRHFQRRHLLQVAAVDVMDQLPLMKVSDALTWVAEALVEHAFHLAWREITHRLGQPRRRSESVEQPGFVAIGYGKMGGLELGYGSDLDLVFLHSGQPEAPFSRKKVPASRREFYIRLGQRVIHLLSTRTLSGRLYEIDSRLRPNGNSGLLVTDLEGFRSYQLEAAWSWEHQALVRARVVFGGSKARERFDEIRREVLSIERDPEQLRSEVCEMREKMRSSLGHCRAGEIHLKQMEGGMVDIEFMVQYLVLRWAALSPALLQWSDNVRLLEQLAEESRLTQEEAAMLIRHYRLFRREAYHLYLQSREATLSDQEFVAERKQVIALWQRLMGTVKT